VAVTSQGYTLETAHPANETSWTSQRPDPENELTGVSCPSAALCVATETGGHVLVSADPSAGSWSALPVEPGTALNGVSCASASACAAVDAAGRVLWSTSPSVSGGWHVLSSPPGTHPPLRGVSCAGTLCVAVGASGETLATSSGPSGPWRLAEAEPARELAAVSCSTSAGCVALDSAGTVLASADPAASPATWTLTSIASGGAGATVSCPDALCVVAQGGESVFASDSATAPVPSWSESRTGGGVSLRAVSCLTNGFCGAVDAGGRWLHARTPEPDVVAAPPSEVGESEAVLAGVVNPQDASLACQFEYGPTNAYGASVPCSAPGPSVGFSTVTARISGLAPNTTYHFRLVVFAQGRFAQGADNAFTTAVSSAAAIVHPHPSIGGTPAPGQTLTCFSGVPPGAARVSYEWLRDAVPIPGEESSHYGVRGQDAGRHIQCRVTAADAGGNATATSSFVTVPLGGVPAAAGETSIGHPRVRGGTVTLSLACSPRAAGACNISLRLTLVETLSGRRIVAIAARTRRGHAAGLRQVTVTLAAARVVVGAGARRTVTLSITRSARRLLAARKRLPAQLAVSGTVIGVLEAPLYQQVLELGGPAHAARHRATGTSR
jgi:hypothetical protein